MFPKTPNPKKGYTPLVSKTGALGLPPPQQKTPGLSPSPFLTTPAAQTWLGGNNQDNPFDVMMGDRKPEAVKEQVKIKQENDEENESDGIKESQDSYDPFGLQKTAYVASSATTTGDKPPPFTRRPSFSSPSTFKPLPKYAPIPVAATTSSIPIQKMPRKVRVVPPRVGGVAQDGTPWTGGSNLVPEVIPTFLNQ